ncbi:hypothetical protein [Streptomyces glaucescens]|uniref:Secreted protein n=1 Tax=Streptomyces glaucescens TaxID=1907 RepID=A0A089X3N6_STRGA|nr:hypothetical protein [Streptomyces glaucescens]AIR98427.1 hypothetical protein SGLAU_12150 [Streptomyces glaucescens]
MTALADLLLPALSKRTAEHAADPAGEPGARLRAQPGPCAFSAESSCAQAPLTSEPPLPDAEPLTSEPPLAAPDADSTRP